MKVLVVGNTNHWLDAVRNALPRECMICICRDELGAFCTQEDSGNTFDLLILSNNLSKKDAGLQILREARMNEEKNPIIIYSDMVCESTKIAIAELDGIHLTESGDGIIGLTRKVKELLLV